MKPMKKVEIVVDALITSRLLDLFARLGIHRWTRIPGASGSGTSGTRSGGDPAGAFDNDYLIVVCDTETSGRLCAAVGPLLRKVGGFLLVSDCESMSLDPGERSG